MALSFTTSYTFSPSTTISSSQVNTNFSDIAAVFQGLEAETKSLAKLKVDIDPTLALEVATKQYVDHLTAYRRPVLVYSSATVVNIETGINGTSGQAQVLFPDGNLRTDSTTTRIHCNLAQNAVLSGTAQSGIRSGSATANTWYMIYAVKVSDSSTNFVTVADTVTPAQSNYSSLNSNFGTSSWVYLGAIAYGDVAGATTSIVSFNQAGHVTVFNNTCSGNAFNSNGLIVATTAGATSLTWTYDPGTNSGAAQTPPHFSVAFVSAAMVSVGSSVTFTNSAATQTYAKLGDATNGVVMPRTIITSTQGGKIVNGVSASRASDIFFAGFADRVLGVGSNPLL